MHRQSAKCPYLGIVLTMTGTIQFRPMTVWNSNGGDAGIRFFVGGCIGWSGTVSPDIISMHVIGRKSGSTDSCHYLES